MGVQDGSLDLPERSLASSLRAYGEFVGSAFRLMRSLRKELKRQGWLLVRFGNSEQAWRGSRNVKLKSFKGWLDDYVAVAFVDGGRYTNESESVDVALDDTVSALIVQVRWLDMSPGGPTIWCICAQLDRNPEYAKNKTVTVGGEMERICSAITATELNQSAREDIGSKRIRRIATRNLEKIQIRGRFFETPVLEVRDDKAVRELLVDRALDMFESEVQR